MAKRIRRFNVGQTAKVLGVLYALLGLVLVPIFLIAARYTPGGASFGTASIVVALPLAYGLVGFVFTAIACLLYNLVAGWVGGIEIETDESAV